MFVDKIFDHVDRDIVPIQCSFTSIDKQSHPLFHQEEKDENVLISRLVSSPLLSRVYLFNN